MKKKIIGFFGGSFDPIHFGHINLALEMVEKHNLDEVIFCPAFCSPFKSAAPPFASPEHRLAMIRLALTPIQRFRVTPIEIERGGPSYTIDTLKALVKEGDFRLILSDEAVARFDQWKDASELIRLAPPLIGTRREPFAAGYGAVGEALRKGITQTRLFEISSTEVRDRIKKNLYCGHLVPDIVLDYIASHRLYS